MYIDFLTKTEKTMLDNIYKKLEKNFDYFTEDELNLMEFLGFFDNDDVEEEEEW